MRMSHVFGSQFYNYERNNSIYLLPVFPVRVRPFFRSLWHTLKAGIPFPRGEKAEIYGKTSRGRASREGWRGNFNLK